MYKHLKEVPLGNLCPDTEEDRQTAHDELDHRKLCECQESVDELTRDIEKLPEKASPGLPMAYRNAELCYHLLNVLPDKVALQLQLLPKADYQGQYQRPGNCS